RGTRRGKRWTGQQTNKQRPGLVSVDYGVTIGTITFALVYLEVADGRLSVALERTAAIVIGIVISAAICGAVFPAGAERELNGILQTCSSNIGDNLRRLASFANLTKSEVDISNHRRESALWAARSYEGEGEGE
ncbi:unnamed protein product, partial [Discosporangium mesarthrocarpum]